MKYCPTDAMLRLQRVFITHAIVLTDVTPQMKLGVCGKCSGLIDLDAPVCGKCHTEFAFIVVQFLNATRLPIHELNMIAETFAAALRDRIEIPIGFDFIGLADRAFRAGRPTYRLFHPWEPPVRAI